MSAAADSAAATTAAAATATAAGRDETSAPAALNELNELLRAVQADPSAFDFYALLRRVDSLRPQQPRTGEAARPRQEALRLAQAAELDFAPAPLHGLEWREGQSAPRLAVRFFGLLGPMGPMPLHFTEVVREQRLHHGDATLAHFLDLFHHRTLSLFYRAWAQAQPVVHLDRPADDRFRIWLGALAGVPADPSDPSHSTDPDARATQGAAGTLPAQALAHHSGWLTARSKHPEMLVKVIGQFFGVRARVEEHVGQWLPVDRSERTRLSFARNRAERAANPPAALGLSANAGSRVWDRQYRFRVHLAPLTHAQTLAFLPGGADWPRLLHWVRLLAGREFNWELEFGLAPSERPEPRLGRDALRSARLGLTCWLGRPRPIGTGGTGGTDGSEPLPPRALRLRPQSSFLAQPAHLARNARNAGHASEASHAHGGLNDA